MDTNQTSNFHHARRFERDLNERQRDILARIAKGQTNAEIAAALDMTFDGAKWNVSEILTKLGFSSREEAADYWHWRQGIGSRTKSALRALVPAGLPMKLVAGGGFAAVAVVVIVMLLLARPGQAPTESPALPPFRMTVSILQRQSGDDFLSNVEIEWQDPRHYRMYLHAPTEPEVPDIDVVVTADGEARWMVAANEPTYSRAEIAEVGWDESPGAMFYMHYGPTTGARTIEELLDELRQEGDGRDPDNPKYANIVGDDLLFGMPVVVIEYGPLWNDSTPEKRAAGWEIHSSGIGRAWIDPETMLILRNESEVDEGHSTLVEVTALELGVMFAAGYFDFVPPEGRTEVRE